MRTSRTLRTLRATSPWAENPLPRLTDQRREDRPYGWLLKAMTAAVQEGWQLAQEIWMIDGLVWNEISPHGLRRACASDLSQGGKEWPDVTARRLRDAAAGARLAITILTGQMRGSERTFRDERSLLPRLSEVHVLFDVLADEAERALVDRPTEAVVAGWQRLAEQELSLPHVPTMDYPAIRPAPPRHPPPLTLEAAAARWGEMSAWLEVAVRLEQKGEIDEAFRIDTGALLAAPEKLDLDTWREIDSFFASHLAPGASPLLGWFFDTLAWVHQQMMVALPAAVSARVAETIHRQRRHPDSKIVGFGLWVGTALEEFPYELWKQACDRTLPEALASCEAARRDEERWRAR